MHLLHKSNLFFFLGICCCWGRYQACTIYQDFEIQCLWMAIHGAWISGSSCEWSSQSTLCFIIQSDSWGMLCSHFKVYFRSEAEGSECMIQDLTCFEQIFGSRQVNGVSLLAYKQLFSRDIYITVITLSFELFEGAGSLAFVMCPSLCLLFTFQKLLGVGFYTCIQFILDETRCTSCAGAVERETCRGPSLQNFILQTWPSLWENFGSDPKNTSLFCSYISDSSLLPAPCRIPRER